MTVRGERRDRFVEVDVNTGPSLSSVKFRSSSLFKVLQFSLHYT